MPRKPNKNKTVPITIRSSEELAAYLEALARVGIHGKTPAEVAKTLVGNEIERLIRDNILQLRKSKKSN
jgi:hypothetical protein